MKVITNVVNNPIFIELQFKSLQKYLKNEFEFIVFNDAKDFPDYTNGGDLTMRQKIIDVCNELNITCINLNNDIHKTILGGSARHSITLNEILKYQIANPDKYLLLDADMFLIDYLDIDKYQNKSAVLLQERGEVRYAWPGIFYFDTTVVANLDIFNWSMNPGITDAGGMTETWLKTQMMEGEKFPSTDDLRWKRDIDYNTSKIYFIKHLWSLTWNENELPDDFKNNEGLITFLKNDKRNKEGKFFCEIYDNVFFHYRGGGCNWMGEGVEFHKLQVNELLKLFI